MPFPKVRWGQIMSQMMLPGARVCWASSSAERSNLWCEWVSEPLVCFGFWGMIVKAFGRRCRLWMALGQRGRNGCDCDTRKTKGKKLNCGWGAWAVICLLTRIIHAQVWKRILPFPIFLQSISCSPHPKENKTWWHPVHCRTESGGQSAVGRQEMINFSRTLHRSFIKHISVVINQWTWFIIAMMPLKSVNTAVSGGLPEHLVPLVSPWAIN